jgi:hypothetical protein
MPAKSVWVASVATLRGEEGHIPILDNIPPERVGRVDERDDKAVGVLENSVDTTDEESNLTEGASC